jgi:hypothetical protein
MHILREIAELSCPFGTTVEIREEVMRRLALVTVIW